MSPVHQQHRDTAVAGGCTRPPLLYLACLLVGLALDRVRPVPSMLPEAALNRWIWGGGLIMIGLTVVAAGVRSFAREATPVPSNQPVIALVTTGIHAWSRNPIYVGMCLVYAGVAIAVRGAWVLILALPLVLILRYGVVAREEAYLERRFGDAYRDYRRRVRRWL